MAKAMRLVIMRWTNFSLHFNPEFWFRKKQWDQ